jgi:hypothetical protein
MILYTLLIPKQVWMNRVEENISDIDRQIFRVLLPDRYKDIFRELLKKYKSLNQIMKIKFPDFERQCLQENIRIIFYQTVLIITDDPKTEPAKTGSFIEEENINE